MKLFLKVLIFCFLTPNLIYAQTGKLILLDSGKNTSLRGVSVVNNRIAWVSGSNGWIARTSNGRTFQWQQIKGFENLDFRDIEAFSAQEAVIVSAGSPAYIFKTNDAGNTWRKVYENKDSLIFLDGMDFWNQKEGIIFGDPINGIMKVLVTKDGGESWEDNSTKANIKLNYGEAAFAASGTTIRTYKNETYIATGGKFSRLWTSKDKGKTWKVEKIPIVQGETSTGAFSIAINKHMVFAVGGDYLKEQSKIDNYAFKNLQNSGWEKPSSYPNGYRSAVEIINKNLLIVTGPTGTDISYNGGKNWVFFSKKGFNTCRKAKNGSLVLFTGSRGKIMKLVI